MAILREQTATGNHPRSHLSLRPRHLLRLLGPRPHNSGPRGAGGGGAVCALGRRVAAPSLHGAGQARRPFTATPLSDPSRPSSPLLLPQVPHDLRHLTPGRLAPDTPAAEVNAGGDQAVPRCLLVRRFGNHASVFGRRAHGLKPTIVRPIAASARVGEIRRSTPVVPCPDEPPFGRLREARTPTRGPTRAPRAQVE
jgi:hypothetical protein